MITIRLTAIDIRQTSMITARNEQDDGLQFCKDGDWDGNELEVGMGQLRWRGH